MRLITQVVVTAILAGVGGGGWHLWQQYAPTGAAATPSGQARQAGAAIAVEVAAVRLGTVRERVESIGTMRANESVTVTAKQMGTVEVIAFNEGQRVRSGAVLVELEARERRADGDQAKAQADEIRQRLDRSKALRGTGSVTEARIDELESQLRAAEARVRATNARQADARITAPFDGRVGMRQVSLGALVSPGTPVTTLDDVSKVKLDFGVPETVLGRLKPGLSVVARTTAYAGRTFSGQVTVIDTRVDPVTRSVRINALFENADEALKPGMFLNVELALAQRDNTLLVPEEALLAEGLKQFVYVVKDGRVQRREVKIGQRQQGEVEVLEGVAADDQVVVRGLQKIRDGQAVTVRPVRPVS
jgi:membrane fusion protein (multidrug efflux system)